MSPKRSSAPPPTVARWATLCPEKAACSEEVSLARQGGAAGTRCRLADGTMILLLAELPPMTTHEAVHMAVQHLSAGDPVSAAKSMGHASPLSARALATAHLEASGIRPPAELCETEQKGPPSTGSSLSERDRLRVQLRLTTQLPVAFVVLASSNSNLVGRKYGCATDSQQAELGQMEAPTIAECLVVSGGWVDLTAATALDDARAPECVLFLRTTPPFRVDFSPWPPQDSSHKYCKVYAVGPHDGVHRTVLLALPEGEEPVDDCTSSAPSSMPPAMNKVQWVPQLSESQRLLYQERLVHTCIERGRLFGGGLAALSSALDTLLRAPFLGDHSSTARGLQTVLLCILDDVRLYSHSPDESYLSFPQLTALALLASCNPSWRACNSLRDMLTATATAAQATDTRRSHWHWREWRQRENGGHAGWGNTNAGSDSSGSTGSGCEVDKSCSSGAGEVGGATLMELCDSGRGNHNAEVRNALRLLNQGFIPLQGESVDMVARYADVFIHRGGLPLRALPLPDLRREKKIGDVYILAAVDSAVLPRLALYVQASLMSPPRCESTNQKDNHLRNVRLFIEQTLFNVRDQKELKIRGGYVDSGDMQRIVGYMDERHFAVDRDLLHAWTCASEDDSLLQDANEEGFKAESECHMSSDRCSRLRKTLREVQNFVLKGPSTANHVRAPWMYTAVQGGAPMRFAEPHVDGRAKLEGFLALFGGTHDLTVDVDGTFIPVKVTLANLEDPSQPFVVQKGVSAKREDKDAQTPDGQHDPYAVIAEPAVIQAVVMAFCKTFDGSLVALPTPPAGLRWKCRDAAALLVAVADDSQLIFSVDDIPVPLFDAGPVLEPCLSLEHSYAFGKDENLLQSALYLETPEVPQIELLHQLRSRAQDLRESTYLPAVVVKGVPEWLDSALRSPIAVLVWQELYARMLLEETCDDRPCVSLTHAHPYQGAMLRALLVLQLIYFDVLIPTRNELTFHIRRCDASCGARHWHLMNCLKTLAFRRVTKSPDQQDRLLLRSGITTDLYPYQVDAVRRLIDGRNRGLHGSLDASGLGTGKTIVALRLCLAVAEAHGGGCFLVLVGSESLMEGWQQQVFEHMDGIHLQLQQENGMLRTVRKTSDPSTPKRRKVSQSDGPRMNIIISTYSRVARYPFHCIFLLVVADECLALQNTQSLQSAAVWRLVTRSLYGGHFISGTMFRRHYRDLLEMLKMLRSSIPLQANYIQAYFRVHLITYMRPALPWQTRLQPMEIPKAVRAQYLAVLDDCKGKDAQNYVQVLSRMRKVLNEALHDGRALAERIWSSAAALRRDGFRPIVFASTEREAEAIVRHIICARRYRQGRHPKNCPGCDECQGFNKFVVGTDAAHTPIATSDEKDTLWVFTVGADAQGLNLQSYGDALILRPLQMDLLVQMMGRLDRPGQTSKHLCRAIIYMQRTHEEAEVAHLEKYAAFWNLHIKPLAKRVIAATVDAEEYGVSISERYKEMTEPADAPDASKVGSDAKVAISAGRGRGRGMSRGKSTESKLVKGSKETPVLVGKQSGVPSIVVRNFIESASASLTPLKRPKCEPAGEGKVAAKFDFKLKPGNRCFAFDLTAKSSPKHIDLSAEEPEEECAVAPSPSPPVRMTKASLQQGLDYLIRRDSRFKQIVKLIGPPTDILDLLETAHPDPFTTIAQTICHQQLSLKICQQMFHRLLELCGDSEKKILIPTEVIKARPEKIREVAQLSFRKISYIRHAAELFHNGTLTTSLFEEASDEELRQRLVQLPGIGEWTVEMFLIFQLHRHGGIPYGDVALQSAMKMVYDIAPPPGVAEKNEVHWSPTKAQMEEYTQKWGPFGTIASLYMLRIADNEKAAIFLPD